MMVPMRERVMWIGEMMRAFGFGLGSVLRFSW